MLRDSKTGMTLDQLAASTGKSREACRSSVNCMPDVYIARWQEWISDRGVSFWTPVYMAAPVPADAPHPGRRRY